MVERVGVRVSRFSVGDAVFGNGRSTLAELAAAKQEYLTPKPEGLSFEQAAVPGVRADRAEGEAERRPRAARPGGAHQRGLRRGRRVRGADRHGARRPCHRRLRPDERRARPLAPWPGGTCAARRRWSSTGSRTRCDRRCRRPCRTTCPGVGLPGVLDPPVGIPVPSSRSGVIRVGVIRPTMNLECAAVITSTGSSVVLPSSSGIVCGGNHESHCAASPGSQTSRSAGSTGRCSGRNRRTLSRNQPRQELRLWSSSDRCGTLPQTRRTRAPGSAS